MLDQATRKSSTDQKQPNLGSISHKAFISAATPGHYRTLTTAEQSGSFPPISQQQLSTQDYFPYDNQKPANELSIGQFMRSQRHQRYSFSNQR